MIMPLLLDWKIHCQQ